MKVDIWDEDSGSCLLVKVEELKALCERIWDERCTPEDSPYVEGVYDLEVEGIMFTGDYRGDGIDR